MGEDAALVRYRLAGWEEQSYVVIRRRREKGQALLLPAYTVILVSRDEPVRRRRGELGEENAFKGPLIDLDLHHPPCRKFRANQAFYIRGPIAQMLLPVVQYRLLPTRGRRWRPDFARNNFRLAVSTTPPSNSNSSRRADPDPSWASAGRLDAARSSAEQWVCPVRWTIPRPPSLGSARASCNTRAVHDRPSSARLRPCPPPIRESKPTLKVLDKDRARHPSFICATETWTMAGRG